MKEMQLYGDGTAHFVFLRNPISPMKTHKDRFPALTIQFWMAIGWGHTGLTNHFGWLSKRAIHQEFTVTYMIFVFIRRRTDRLSAKNFNYRMPYRPF